MHDTDTITPPADWWTGVDLERLRHDGHLAETIETSALNPEASAYAASLRHRRLDPAAIAMTLRLADLALGWMTAFMVQLLLAGQTDVTTSALHASVLAVALVSGLWLARGYRLRALAQFLPAWARLMVPAGVLVAIAGLSGIWGAASAMVSLSLLTAWAAVFALSRIAASGFVRWCLAAGATERRAAIIGGGGNADRLIRGLAARPDSDIRVVALFDDRSDDRSPPLVAGCRKLGTVAELVAFARIAELDMLIVTLPLSAEARIVQLLRSLWVLPLDIRLSAYSDDYSFPRRGSAAQPGLIGVMEKPLPGFSGLAKRLFDIGVAALALTALSPVMLLAAVAIRLDSPGPVFFRQPRHGFNHRAVDVWKFRSMYAEQCDPGAACIVTQGDSRVTRVGRFIRRTSIDELPQLFNVLDGTLSLVGPRPHAVHAQSSRQELFCEIVEGYSGRHRMPPGITGWAQVNGWRGEIVDPDQLRQRFEHDLYYIENWSLWLDIRILLATPLALFDTRHAY